MKGNIVTETAKEIKFQGILVELETRKCFQTQPVTGYLRPTPVFTQSSDLLGLTKFSI